MQIRIANENDRVSVLISSLERKDGRDFFMKTKRIGFSEWEAEDIELAKLLWGDSEVTRFICASGIFRQEEIEKPPEE